MKRSRKLTSQALLSLVVLGMAAGASATPIYVNDNWGATPTRSNATIPYEGQVEDRIWFNPKNGTYHLTQAAAEAATPPNVATGPAALPTGLENIEYFPLGGPYLNIPNGNAVPAFTDPITKTTVSGAIMGTTAFATIKDAIFAIGNNTAPAGTTSIVILGGTYYETLFFPRNHTVANPASPLTLNYYSPLTLSDFDGKMQVGFSILGDPEDRPIITRGLVLDAERTDGLTIANIVFAGQPGPLTAAGIGTGAPGNGSAIPTASISEGYTTANNKIVRAIGGATVWPDPGIAALPANATGTGYRRNLTFDNNVFEGYGIRIPFGNKAAVNGPYTTAPTYNNIVGTGGGRQGMSLNGEYGTLTITRNIFRGLRGFIVFDTNAQGNGNATWTTANIFGNTIIDCWGNFALRGEDPGAAPLPAPGRADLANVSSNTVRNMGEGILEFVSLVTPDDTLIDHRPQSGAAFKMFNIRQLDFINNSITRVNIMQDWFTKAVQVRPGHPDFIPMGAGLLVRDLRDSAQPVPAGNPTDWTGVDRTTAFIAGNLFERTQQGIGIDPPGAQKYIPAGLITGNTFLSNRSGIFVYDALINSIQWTVTGNIFSEPSDDPLETGVTSGSNTNLVGGVVFGANSGVAPETPAPTANLEDNFWGDVSGPSGIGSGSGAAIIVPSAAPSFGIASITNQTPTRINTSTPHSFSTGMSVTVNGSLRASLNGNTYTITVVTGTQFILDGTVAAGAFGAGGTVTGSSTVNPGDMTGSAAGEFQTVFPNLDSDGDGVADVVEIALGLNPNNRDTDNDGVPDGLELRFRWDANDINDPVIGGANVDSDGDGIPDFYELIIGTNRFNPDTDGDGIRDDYEILVGTDPLNANSFPLFGNADPLDPNPANAKNVNNLDAIRILLSALDVEVLRGINRGNIDINRDGQVNAIDAVILYQYLLGNIDFIPYPPLN